MLSHHLVIRERAARIRIVAAGLVLVAGACGGSGSSDSSKHDRAAPEFGSEEFGLTLEELGARVEQVEATIATCMTDAGFEYVPVDFPTIMAAMDSDETAPGLSDEEYLDQYGFGITTQFDKPIRTNGLGEQNARIFEALPEADRVAYNRALYGEDPDQTLAVALEIENFAGAGGCTRAAAEEFFTREELTATYVNPGDVLIEQDPRMVTALADWSTCMRDAGHDYNHPDDITRDLKERFDGIVQGTDPTTLTGPDLDALTALQGEERAVAVVATDCEDEIIAPVEEDIEAELYGAPQN